MNYLLLPSWVLDWSRKGDRDQLRQRQSERGTEPLVTRLEPTYSAYAPLEWAVASDAAMRDAVTDSLQLQSMFFGQVGRQVIGWGDDAGRWLDGIVQLESVVGNITTEEGLNAVLRTAVADQQIRARHEDGRTPRMEKQFLSMLMGSSRVEASAVQVRRRLKIWASGITMQMWCLAWGRRSFTSSSHWGLGRRRYRLGLEFQILFVVRQTGRTRWKLWVEMQYLGLSSLLRVRSNHLSYEVEECPLSVNVGLIHNTQPSYPQPDPNLTLIHVVLEE